MPGRRGRRGSVTNPATNGPADVPAGHDGVGRGRQRRSLYEPCRAVTEDAVYPPLSNNDDEQRPAVPGDDYSDLHCENPVIVAQILV